MNEHLQPVFEDLLPELERERINYWVYGGIGIAAVVGKFIRHNTDVDIFVDKGDFEGAILLLQKKCEEISLTPHHCKLSGGRPKFEVRPKSGTKDLLSVVPVYRIGRHVEFIFGRRRARYHDQILEETRRSLDSYGFFSPPDGYIRELFKAYLTNRPGKRSSAKVQIDAKAILNPDELRKLIGKGE